MPRRPTLLRLPATLLPAVGGRSFARHRLLVVGAAVIARPRESTGPWQVPVSTDGRFEPVAPTSRRGMRAHLRRLRAAGCRVRIAAEILEPHDLPQVAPLLRDMLRKRPPLRRREFYGWALLYQLPGQVGIGLVDPHEEHPELPAFYESACELADRQEYLLHRGIPARALAIMTERHDFEHAPDQPPRNRFSDAAHWSRASGFTALDP